MPKAKAVTTAEREYLERRLAPVLQALREDETLREEFLLFVQQRGGGISLTLERLKTVWWPSRKSMYPGFFVLAVVEFGLVHGLFPGSPAKPKARRR
jgi:ABC-type phosphate transport system auxiliary subunit